jgi:NAD(P)H-hydrate epimerase
MEKNSIRQNELPVDLYRAEQVRELDRRAIEELGIPGLTLMERAGGAAFELMSSRWTGLARIAVVCGTGNNGGDGYVVARRALESGMEVSLLQLGDVSKIKGDARSAADAYLAAGGEVTPFNRIPDQTQVIVDGVFGTGLEREVTGAWREALEAINRHPAPVLALDIPSGLHADTGQVLGMAVDASSTISFIGLKRGLFTGEGAAQCGTVYFHDLGVPAETYSGQQPSAQLIRWSAMRHGLGKRSRTAHKGDFGHLLVIGGDHGFAGAARMAAEAGARTGSGLVSLATRAEHAAVISAVRPELMCRGVEKQEDLRPLLERATVIAIGPGLGQSAWSTAMLAQVMETDLPMVLDADALNLLAREPVRQENWVLTPHPGEAARLMGCSSEEIQADRFLSVRRLQERYGGVVVLKGAGTLIQTRGRPPALCTDGNPGMASGGMGDVLTGVIGGLIAQGVESFDAARMGVSLHGAAADQAAALGERGLLAGDVIAEIRGLANP